MSEDNVLRVLWVFLASFLVGISFCTLALGAEPGSLATNLRAQGSNYTITEVTGIVGFSVNNPSATSPRDYVGIWTIETTPKRLQWKYLNDCNTSACRPGSKLLTGSVKFSGLPAGNYTVKLYNWVNGTNADVLAATYNVSVGPFEMSVVKFGDTDTLNITRVPSANGMDLVNIKHGSGHEENVLLSNKITLAPITVGWPASQVSAQSLVDP